MTGPQILRVTLPLPPSVNHSHNLVRLHSKAGKPYTSRVPSAKTRAWRDEAWWLIKREVVCKHWRTITGAKVVVELTYYWPDRRRRDTHNRIKEIMDALTVAGVFADDCQALARERDYRIDRDRPRVEVQVGRKA